MKGSGPSARHNQSLTVIGHHLYIFGGCRNANNGLELTYFDDFYNLDLKCDDNFTGEWNCIETRVRPAPRSMHVAVAVEDKIYMYQLLRSYCNV
jgi:N-acetylneuraminic acid mutarotase